MNAGRGYTRIEWRDAFEIGIPSIDHEHRALVERLNEVFASIEASEANAETLAKIGEVYTWISAHFALEEVIMREHRYDQYEDHKADHERLLDEIRDIMEGCEAGQKPAVDKALSGRLEAWFSDHFKTKDARLHKHLGDR
jgi:hemerythrin-like metal-binding protein